MVYVIAKYKFPRGACDGELYKCKDYEQALKQKEIIEKNAVYKSIEIEVQNE